MANRRALTEDQAAELAEAYLSGESTHALARRFGVGLGAVRGALARQGVALRAPAEVNAPGADPAEIARLYHEEKLHAWEIAERLGVSDSTVRKHAGRAGEMRPGRSRYRFDRAFFNVSDELRAYWAGFLAADGSIVGNTVSLAVAERDREIPDRLAAAAGCAQPVRLWRRADGRAYAHLRVTSPEWANALRERYGLRVVEGGKARSLIGPSLESLGARWAFIRGFFDGDGHASKAGGIIITSASSAFLDWVETVTGAATARDELRYMTLKGERRAWNLRYGRRGLRGGRAGEVARFLYAGSTPETRLARKHERLRRWL